MASFSMKPSDTKLSGFIQKSNPRNNVISSYFKLFSIETSSVFRITNPIRCLCPRLAHKKYPLVTTSIRAER